MQFTVEIEPSVMRIEAESAEEAWIKASEFVPEECIGHIEADVDETREKR